MSALCLVPRRYSVIALLTLLSAVGQAHGQNLLQITSPADGTVVQQGQTINVTFAADPSVSNIALTAEFNGGWIEQTSGPNTFSLTIPSTTPIEQYQVYVIGTAGGQLVVSPSVTLQVDTPLSIGTIHTIPRTLQLASIGDVLPLTVVGTLSDGTSAIVTHSPRISFSSTNMNIVTVDGRGNVTAVAPGSAFVTITGGTIPYNVYSNVAVSPVPSPIFNPLGGTYIGAQTVTLTDATIGSAIYFTTDGTLPTARSTQYSTSIKVTSTETIDALAVANGAPDSEVTIAKYQILSATSLVLGSGANPANLGSQITLTATLSPYAIGGESTNGEPVTFYNGGASLGTGTLSSGVAAISLSSLPAGTSTLTAAFVGDAFFAASTSPALNETVVAPNYSVTISPSSGTIAPGGAIQPSITVSPAGGFDQQISFGCSGLPAYSTCNFSPATVTPDGTNTAKSTTLTISTNVANSVLQNVKIPHGSGHGGLVGDLLLVLGGLLIVGKGARRLSWKANGGLAGVLSSLVVATALLVGCAGSPESASTANTPAGNYTVTVAAISGSNRQTATLTLTVQ